MPEIILENTFWWLLPVAGASFLFSWWLYFRGRQFNRGQRLGLSIVRFFIFFFLGLLLLSPLWRDSERVEEKPVLVWLEDHSQSMVLAKDSNEVRVFLNNRNALIDKLSERYQTEVLSFSDKITNPTDSFMGRSTDLAEALQGVRERYYNQNVGAVVLVSDGIWNVGGNASYAAAGLPYPVFTVGVGDTALQKDLFIDRIVTNDVSFLGNNFPVEVYIKARQLEGRDYTLTVTDREGKRFFRQSYNIDSRQYFLRADFQLKADPAGLRQYTVSLSPIEGEKNRANNTASFSIEVISDRKKIAIIGRGAHPDMGAIASALKSVEKYEVNAYIEPDLPAILPEADLYILHDPSADLMNRLQETTTACWLIEGPNTPSNELARIFKVQLASQNFEDVSVFPASGFNLFELEEETIQFLKDVPPLWGPFGTARTGFPASVLFTKKINTLVTEEPLWFFNNQDRQRRAFTLGTGLWKWRIHNFRMQRTHRNFNELITKTVQYLTTDERGQRFDVDIAGEFDSNEPIRGEARLYNSSMQLTNTPEVNLVVKNEEGREFNFAFGRSRNTYRLNAGKLPEGIYMWTAVTQLGDEEFSRNGSFLVTKNTLEETDLLARHDILQKMARETGGAFFTKDQQGALAEALLNNQSAKTRLSMETTTRSFIEEKWIFFIFLVLLTAEWALRKYFGNY